jgi:hypothetical protein
MSLLRGEVEFRKAVHPAWRRLGEVSRLAVVFRALVLEERGAVTGRLAVESWIGSALSKNPNDVDALGTGIVNGCLSWCEAEMKKKKFLDREDVPLFKSVCSAFLSDKKMRVDLSTEKESQNESAYRSGQHLIMATMWRITGKDDDVDILAKTTRADLLMTEMVMSLTSGRGLPAMLRIMKQCILCSEDLYYVDARTRRMGIPMASLSTAVFNSAKSAIKRARILEPSLSWLEQPFIYEVENVEFVTRWLVMLGMLHMHGAEASLNGHIANLEECLALLKSGKPHAISRIEEMIAEAKDARDENPSNGVTNMETMKKRADKMKAGGGFVDSHH